ncbi:MAG: glycosyltransferase family 2 protein [Patescibacteria group bacterium]
MDKQDSLVSIGMPTKDRGHLIRRALDSLLSQTYKNFELIISDNGSSDDTQKICEVYALKDSRIRYFRQTENIGVGSAHNFDFVRRQARGKYFMWATDDDWWDPKFIETLKNILDKNPDFDLAMSSFDRGGEYVFSGDKNLTLFDGVELFFHIFSVTPKNKSNMAIYGLFRREFIQKFFRRAQIPLPPYLKPERVLIAEMALCAKFYTIPDILFKKFLPENRVIRSSRFKGYSAAVVARILAFVLTSPNVSLARKLKVLARFHKLPHHRGNFIRFTAAVFAYVIFYIFSEIIAHYSPAAFSKELPRA